MDILESTTILHIICRACNLTTWQYDDRQQRLRRSNLLQCYTIVVLAVSTAFLLHDLFWGHELFMDNNSDIGEAVDYIQMIGIRFAHVICVGETLLQRQMQQLFYEKVLEIDKIFKCALNIDVNNRKFRNRTLQSGLLMLSVYVLSELFILATKIITKEKGFPLFWIFYLLPLLVCGMRYYQIFTSVNIIKRRFEKLIQILVEVNLQEPASKNLAYQPTYLSTLDSGTTAPENEEQAAFRRLLIIRDLYNRLWELTNLLNRTFGLSMLINVGNDFVSITSNCYWIFLNFKQFSSRIEDFLQIASSAVWSVPHLLNVLVLAIICERTAHCSTRMALSLHCIQIDIRDDNHNTVIEQFSLQLLHQKLTFTASGFFNVDCTLLYTIVGATTTYLIILIQFHMSEVGLKNK